MNIGTLSKYTFDEQAKKVEEELEPNREKDTDESDSVDKTEQSSS